MYQALYRVWRPQSFSDMVGQELIAQTLRNAVKTGKISHAYLFSGPRGTGKTSAAKIFAKAINCTQQVDGQPCNHCENCLAIAQGSMSDVIEIDAASNNGIDEIRDIRDKSRYAPAQAQYKVYIIDEVHMLSIGAFNALLKTLEEPTKNVVFILATTEPHKIPATILSRVQRFDFQRITTDAIVGRLAHILNVQQTTFETSALELIARVANGGMRDALSLLDQALSHTTDTLTLDVAIAITGTLTQDELSEYLLAVSTQNIMPAIRLLKSMLDNGKVATRIVEELCVFIKEVLLSRFDQTVTTYNHLKDIDTVFLYRVIDVLLQTQQQLKMHVQQDLYVEVMTMQLAQLSQVPIVSATDNALVQQLQERITQLESRLEQLEKQDVTSVTDIPVKSTPIPQQTKKDFVVNVPKIFSVLEKATRQDKDKITQEWNDILSCLNVQQKAKLNASTVLAASATGVVIGFEYELLCSLTASDTALKEAVSEHAMRLIGHPCYIECVPNNQWQNIRSQFVKSRQIGKTVEQEEMFEDDMPKDVLVEQATQLFGDLVEIKEEN